jgi:hypothetical protein
MKFKYFAVALFALAAMSEPVFADQRDDAYAAVERWADAFNSGDVEKIVGIPKEGSYDFTSCWSGVSSTIAFSKTQAAGSSAGAGAVGI